MITQSSRSLLDISSQCKTIPIVENRVHFTQVLDISQIKAILLRHCNLFELTSLLHNAHRRGLSVYVYIDHIDGIHADSAGLRYLAEQLHVTGILSNHPRILSLGKSFGLETIQRIFAVDSTGLEMAKLDKVVAITFHCIRSDFYTSASKGGTSFRCIGRGCQPA